jgi:hypothetical protein
MNFRIPSTALALALFFVVNSASAQSQSAGDQSTWLRDRRYTEGPGYRVGDLELHPGIAGEVGYDSNYLLRAPNEFPGSSIHLQVTPTFSIATLGAQRHEAGGPPPEFTFRGATHATYHEFVPLTGGQTTKDTLQQARSVSGNLDLSLGILPNRTWSGSIYGSVARIVLPSESGIGGNFNRIAPSAGGELVFQPGGGLFDWRLGYTFSGSFFEAQTQLTNVVNEVSTHGRWLFLPRTSVVFDGRQGLVTYTGSSTKTGSRPLRARLGISGLVTPSVGVTAMAGWGTSFYDGAADQNFDSAIGQLELKYYLTPNPGTDPAAATLALSSVAVGATRDFVDSYIGTYYERDRGYLNVSYFFNGRFLVAADGGAAAVRYPTIVAPVKHAAFTDVRVDASLFSEYRLQDSVGLNFTLKYDQNISSTKLTSSSGVEDNLAFSRVQAIVGARWFM